LIAPNQAVHLAKSMRASASVRYVSLALENYRSDPLRNNSTRHIRFAPNRLCRIPPNQPTLLTAFDAFTNIQNP
jgi:hypothetical protein